MPWRWSVDQLLAEDTESTFIILDPPALSVWLRLSPEPEPLPVLHELRRAVRVLERLTDEMTRRLGAPAPRGSPRLVLVH